MSKNIEISKNASIVVALGVLLTGLAPAYAHHSFVTDYDSKNSVTIEGKVTEIWWHNPHVRIYLEVQGGDGATSIWEVESINANVLRRRGWRPNTFSVGQKLTATGSLARDGSNRLFLEVFVLEDGSEMRPASKLEAETRLRTNK